MPTQAAPRTSVVSYAVLALTVGLVGAAVHVSRPTTIKPGEDDQKPFYFTVETTSPRVDVHGYTTGSFELLHQKHPDYYYRVVEKDDPELGHPVLTETGTYRPGQPGSIRIEVDTTRRKEGADTTICKIFLLGNLTPVAEKRTRTRGIHGTPTVTRCEYQVPLPG